MFFALSTKLGGSENQAARNIFLAIIDNWQCKINKNVGSSGAFFFFP